MADKNTLPYRPGVGMMLVNDSGLVFVAKRIDSTAEAWQMPQGGIDANEDPAVAALRELEEEIGTNKAEIVAEIQDWLTYDLPDELIGKLWGGKFRGQKQKWFLLKFLGTDSDINIQTQHPEFLDWKWVAKETLPDLIVLFKKEMYQRIVDEFNAIHQ